MELPRRLSLEVTARCNYGWPFCYGVWHERPELAWPELGTEEWGAILEECARRGVKEVQFTGGEPLLRDDLDELIDRARAAGLKTAVYTNASLLDEGRLESFRRQRVSISTSLPGLASHGTMTGTGREAWPTLEAIERASEVGWPMGVGITEARPNLSEVADLVAAAALAGAGAIQVGAAMWEGRMKGRTDWMLSAEEWEGAKAAARAVPTGKIRVTFADEFFCSCREQPGHPESRWPSPPGECPAGRAFGVIGPTGRLRRCLHTVEEMEWREGGGGQRSGHGQNPRPGRYFLARRGGKS